MRIAVLNPELTAPRGAQRQAIVLAREWRRMGHEVHLVCGEKASPYAFDPMLAELPPVRVTGPWAVHLRRGGTLPGSNYVRLRHTRRVLARVARELEAERFDVVHAHNHPAQWIASETRFPVAWTCNEPPTWHYYPTLRNRLANPFARAHDARNRDRLRAILVLDGRMERMVGAAYPGVPLHRVGSGCELPGPLPPPGAAPPPDLAPLDPGRWHVLSVLGGLTRQKRPLDHVEAVIASGLRDATLHVVGGDPEGLAPRMQARAREAGLDLRLHPALSDAAMLHLYARCQAALFVPENQPWGIFPLEALLAGLPAVISDEVGAREVLPPGYPWVVPTGDAKAAGAALAGLRAAPDAARKPVEEARRLVAAERNWTATARRTLDVLAAVAGTGP